MKNLLRSLSVTLSFTVAVSSFAQKDNVGIGTSKPDQSAVLDLSSSNKGLLMPRMSLQQKTTIQSPAVGLVVYQTDFLSGFYYYDGKDWKSMSSVGQNSIAGTDGDWTIGGNGASPSAATVADVIGTLTNNPIAFKVNGTKSGYIDNSAREQFFLGYNSGSASYLPSMGTGFWNLGIGTSSLYTNTNGNYNTGIGAQTLRFATGDGNTAVGALSLFNLRSGIYNMALGSGSLRDAVSSAANTAVGTNSLITSLGSGNVALGYQTAINKTGDRNVYIGFFAGANGTDVTSPVVNISESDKLYIANSSTTTPLIKGDFANNSLRFHLGATVQGNLAFLNRQNFSFPPDHGARLVTMILEDEALRADWKAELEDVRRNMLSLRQGLADALRDATGSDRYGFVAQHRGMFSRLGLTPEQVVTLRVDHGIYMVGDSRINIAGLNAKTVPILAAAIAKVAGQTVDGL